MRDKLSYICITPKQTDNIRVFAFKAKADDIIKFAEINRISRDDKGNLIGFQRQQIANHINEIRDYLQSPNAILPNSLIVAFTSGIEFEKIDGDIGKITIDVSEGPKGLIVDGQQRFMALSSVKDKEFEVFVSGFICDNQNELQKQFILINNTKPLPKALIYELLPIVNGLPTRMSSRTTAASLTEFLNYREDSSLKGLIYQQTNPYGIIRDTAIQKVIMNSLSDGAMRLMVKEHNFSERAFTLLSNFFTAVKNTFSNDWNGHTPKTSRLVHGAGIVSMGYVMETLYSINQSDNVDDFGLGLKRIKDRTAWTKGVWDFGPDDKRIWNSIQYVPRDVRQLSLYLISSLKRSISVEA